jgi:phenylalanyl-tRNA synthetase beta subunit
MSRFAGLAFLGSVVLAILVSVYLVARLVKLDDENRELKQTVKRLEYDLGQTETVCRALTAQLEGYRKDLEAERNKRLFEDVAREMGFEHFHYEGP